MKKRPVMLLQGDQRWRNVPYTIDGDTQTETIGKSGCGPTSLTMILATWVNPKVTPVEVCKLAITLKDRTADNGTEWEFFRHMADRYHMGFEQTGDLNKVLAALKEEDCYVIASMDKGVFTKGGHFILLWNYENGKIAVNDPASQVRSNLTYDPSIFRREAKQYFIFRKVK